jgi:hypothetical protein
MEEAKAVNLVITLANAETPFLSQSMNEKKSSYIYNISADKLFPSLTIEVPLVNIFIVYIYKN